MGTPADIIVSAFATPPRDDLRAMAQDLYLFDDKPVIVDVPYHQYMRPEDRGMAAGAFKRAADALTQPDGSILRGLFKRYLKGHDVRSVSVVTFSAGTVFLEKLLKSPDAEHIDSVIVLDGVHLDLDWEGRPWRQEIEPWVSFAHRAAMDERLMVLAHTHIAPRSTKVSSTRESSREILYGVDERLGSEAQWAGQGRAIDLDLLLAGPPPPSLSIRCGNPPTTKEFEESPLLSYDQRGNFWSLDYGGTGGPDHCYVAWYGQRDIWRALLAPRLNQGIGCRMPDLSGLGRAYCLPNRVLVPEGVYPTGSLLAPLAALVGGLAVGTGAGYWAARAIGA
jgi:hypothetical protein